MTYWGELRAQWRPLLAALIGLGCGFSTTSYITSIMAPRMLAEFGWPNSEFALIGSLGMISVFLFPFVGRLTDKIGVRKTALIGVVIGPICYVALSMMNGDIRLYIALFLVQAVFFITTTTTVYSRTVVQYVTKARGLALAIVASGPAITGAIGAPLLNNFVEAEGWRAGYVATAIFATIAGAIALLLLPAERKTADGGMPLRAGSAKTDYPEIFRERAFWILVGAMLLVNLPQVVALTQLNILLEANGVLGAAASPMISAFAIGVLVGRFASGVALDRFPAYLVAAIGLALPSVGLFIIASSYDTPWVLTMSVLLIGLSFGAEGDVVGYLVSHIFPVRLFSSVMGMMTAAMATSSAVGAALLSYTLNVADDRFEPFLVGCGFSVLVGAGLLLFLPRNNPRAEEAVAAAG